MSIDPREIDYIIDADARKAINEVNDFIAKIGQATNKVEALADQVSKLFGAQNSRQVRQAQSDLAKYAKGTEATQLASAAQRRKLADVRADPANRLLQTEKAIFEQRDKQRKVMEPFLRQYDRMLEIRKRVWALDKDVNAGNLKAQQLQNQELAKARQYINSIVSTLPAEAQGRMRDRLERTLTDPGYMGGFRKNVANAYYKARVGVPVSIADTSSMVDYSDTVRAKERFADAEKRTAVLSEQLERDRVSRLKQREMAENAIHKKFMSEYRKMAVPAMKRAGSTDQMDAIHAGTLASFESRFAGMMGPSFGPVAFDRSRYDDFYSMTQQAEIERRQAQLNRQKDLALASQARREESDRLRREKIKLAEEARRQRQANAPAEGALGARRRLDAFGGAGIFSIQGSLIANYATMAAGLGSAGFLGNYMVTLEASLAKLQAIASATDGEMRGLERTIIKLATTSKVNAQDITEAATTMAQAGLTAAQINKALPSVINLAVGTDTDLATTVDTITSTMTVFNLQTSEAQDVANTLTAAMNLSKLSIDKYALGLQYSGNIAETVGIQYNELAAILGGMTDAGIRAGSTLGTGLRQLMLDLQAPTNKAQDTFKRLGLSASDLDIESQGIFRVLKNLKEAGFSTADATEAFEVRAVAAFKALMNKLPDIERLNMEILQTSAATDAAAVQMDTLAAKGNQFASAAGTTFFRSTEGIRESLKGSLDVVIALTAAIGALGPVLDVASSAGIIFMGVWAANRIKNIITGMFEMRAAIAANAAATTAASGASSVYAANVLASTAATGRFAAVLRLLNSPLFLVTAALTAFSIGFNLISAGSDKAAKDLEKAKETTNRAADAMSETRETIDALSTTVGRLSARYDVLSKENSPELKSEIEALRTRFSEYGLTLEETGENIDTIIEKTTQLRGELASTAAMQASIQIASLQAERDAAARKAREDAAKGNSWIPNSWGRLFGTEQTDTVKYTAAYSRSVNPLFAPTDMSALANRTAYAEVATKYINLYDGLSAEQAKALDLNEIQRDTAVISQYRQELQRLQMQAGPGKGKKFNNVLKNVDTMLELLSFFDEIASNNRNLNLKEDAAGDILNLQNSINLADTSGFSSAVATLRGQISQSTLDIQDLASEGFGADVIKSKFDTLQEDMKEPVGALRQAQADFIQSIMDEGWAKTEEEAKAIFERMPIFEDYTYVTNILDRENYLAAAGASDLLKDVFSQAGQTARSEMRMILQQAKARKGVVDPEAGVNFVPMDLKEAVDGVMSAYGNETAALREEFKAKYRGMFDTDADGTYKNPIRVQEYMSAVEQAKNNRDAILAQIYKVFGIEYDPSGKRAKDERVELLKAQAEALKAQLDRIAAGVDTQSSPEAIAEAIGQYQALFDQYAGIRRQIADMEWDNTKFTNPQVAAELKSAAMASVERDLEETGKKTIAGMQNKFGDVQGRLSSKLAAARLKTLESLFGAAQDTGDLIDTEGAKRERLRLGNELLGKMVDAYIEEFNNDPTNKDRLNTQEVMDRRAEGVAAFISKQAEFVAAVTERSVNDQVLRQQMNVDRSQAAASMLDNRVNAPGVSQTQRMLANLSVSQANEQALKTNVSALQGAEGDLMWSIYDQKDLMKGLDQTSPEYLARLEAVKTLETQLGDVRIRLAQATNDYAIATGRANDPATVDLMRGSLENFVLQSDILLTATETVADGLGGVFSAMKDGFSEAVTSVVTGAASIGDAFRNMGQTILKAMLDLAVKVLTNYLIIQVLKLIGSFLPGGGFSQGFADAFAASGFGNVPIAGKALGGEVTGGIPGRDSVLTKLMPGEVVMRKTAVDSIGRDTLLQANATGRLAQQTALVMSQSQKREPDMVNVYVVSPDQKPSLSKNDIIVTLMDDVRQGGPVKKMIKQVAIGG